QVQTTTAQVATGCPAATPDPASLPRGTGAEEQRFDKGTLVWIQDTKSIYVLLDPSGQNRAGTVEVYPDNWHEGLADTDKSIVPPAGRAAPVRGFGYLWLTNQHVRDELGWPLVSGTGYTVLIVTQGNKTWFNGQAYNTYVITGNTWQE